MRDVLTMSVGKNRYSMQWNGMSLVLRDSYPTQFDVLNPLTEEWEPKNVWTTQQYQFHVPERSTYFPDSVGKIEQICMYEDKTLRGMIQIPITNHLQKTIAVSGDYAHDEADFILEHICGAYETAEALRSHLTHNNPEGKWDSVIRLLTTVGEYYDHNKNRGPELFSDYGMRMFYEKIKL